MDRNEVGLRRALFDGTTPASLRNPRPSDDDGCRGPKVSVFSVYPFNPNSKAFILFIVAARGWKYEKSTRGTKGTLKRVPDVQSGNPLNADLHFEGLIL